MATFFLISSPLSLSHSHSLSFPFKSSSPSPYPNSSTVRFAGDSCRRKVTMVTRAGPSTSSYVFAFALPLSLLAVTIFTSIRIADKLDRDFLEEMANNEAIMEADDDDEEEEEEDDMETHLQEEPALPRARNRPKREA